MEVSELAGSIAASTSGTVHGVLVDEVTPIKTSSLLSLSSLASSTSPRRQLIITGIKTGNETKRNETEVTSTVPHLTATGFSYPALHLSV